MYTSPENMDFVDANPLATCTSGGNSRVVMMVANQSLPEDVIPIFQIHVHGSHRPDLDQFLVQPTKQGWGTSSVIRFTTPPQPNMNKISENFSIKLTARNGSGNVSNSKFDFEYVEHNKVEDGQKRGGGSGWQGGNNFNNNCYGAPNTGGYGGMGQGRRDCLFCGHILD
eukprot:TRINITY_DN8531_c0_g1_i1.p1 TRINITY_DN8531_c0_g1~~TRINITY_DN8531_c0_g1_i1.p1  ORF type:complete len:169 (-),score=40.36 TRINITY_DN8531_c0_g1_i1:52-558(-)